MKTRKPSAKMKMENRPAASCGSNKIEKDIRHSKNLAGFTGYWHGAYYLLGVHQPNRKGIRKAVNIYKFRANKSG